MRDVTKEATVESNTPDMAKVDATPKVSGERTGEATLLVRYQGKFCNRTRHRPQSEARLRVEGASAKQLHRSAHRCQAAEAPHPAFARNRRRCLSSASLSRSDGPTPHAGRRPRLPGRRDAIAVETREENRQAHREPRVRRSLDRQMG